MERVDEKMPLKSKNISRRCLNETSKEKAMPWAALTLLLGHPGGAKVLNIVLPLYSTEWGLSCAKMRIGVESGVGMSYREKARQRGRLAWLRDVRTRIARYGFIDTVSSWRQGIPGTVSGMEHGIGEEFSV
jgi:hypothetical protein